MSGNIATNESTASGLATVVLNTPDSTYPNGQALSALSTGLVKVTTGTGALTTAVAADLPTAGIGAGAHGAALIKSITTDAQGRVTAETDGVAGADYASPGGRDYWRQQAIAKLATAGKALTEFWWDAADGGNIRQSNSGTTSGLGAVTTLDGGWWTATAGNGTLAGSNLMLPAALPGSLATVSAASLRASKYFIVLRMKVTTTPSATCLIGIRSTTAALRFGVNKQASATKFCAAQGTLLSTVSFDTSAHEIVVGCDGSNEFASVDGEAYVTQASTALANSSDEFGIECTASSGEAAQTYQVDYFGFWVVRG